MNRRDALLLQRLQAADNWLTQQNAPGELIDLKNLYKRVARRLDAYNRPDLWPIVEHGFAFTFIHEGLVCGCISDQPITLNLPIRVPLEDERYTTLQMVEWQDDGDGGGGPVLGELEVNNVPDDLLIKAYPAPQWYDDIPDVGHGQIRMLFEWEGVRYTARNLLNRVELTNGQSVTLDRSTMSSYMYPFWTVRKYRPIYDSILRMFMIVRVENAKRWVKPAY